MMDDATLLAKFGESGAPNRACNLMLKIGADTPGAAADALRNLAFLIDTGGLTHGFSAGYDSSYSYDWQAAESPTHDEWAASLAEWAAARAMEAARKVVGDGTVM